MEYLVLGGNYEQINRNFDRYYDYLRSIRDALPTDTYDLATGAWHYDAQDHWSLHDSWVEEVSIREEMVDAVRRRRALTITIRLLGPYHDGHAWLHYRGVHRYRIELEGLQQLSERPVNHGDWSVDEIRLTSNNTVLHEIQFSSGATWLIECEGVAHKTDILRMHE